jgi:hypothetical protein
MTAGEKIATTGAIVLGLALVVYYLFRTEPVRETLEPPVVSEGGLGLSRENPMLPPGKTMFRPTLEWQPVGDDQVCPPGLEYKLNVYDGTKFARIVQ